MDLIIGVYSLVTNTWRSGAKVTLSGVSTKVTDYTGRVYYPNVKENTLYKITAELDGHIIQSKDFTTATVTIETDMYLSGAGVDIRATNIAVNPSNIKMGDKFDIMVTYKNTGSSGSQEKTIYSDSVRIGSKYVTLNANDSKTETYAYMTGACPQLCKGTHIIKCDNISIGLAIGQSDLFKDVWVNPTVKDKDLNTPISGAVVTIGTESKTTDAYGKTTTFKLEVNVSYNFRVVATGYKDYVSVINYSAAITYEPLIQLEKGISTLVPWKCSGNPDYKCIQALDGTYSTEADCQAKCKADYTFYILLAVVVVMIIIILIRRK